MSEGPSVSTMAATGEWELVKNSRKKGSSVPNGKLSKEEKKNFIEKAPKVTATGENYEVVAELWRIIWSHGSSSGA